MRSPIPWAFLLAATFVLAACETLGLSTPVDPNMPVDLSPVCPASAILSDAVAVTKLRAGTSAAGRSNPANVLISADMTQAQMITCNYDRVKNTLSVDLRFNVHATRGPAAGGDNPQLDFFVAVVDADNNILAKTVYHSQAIMEGKAVNTYIQRVNNYVVPLGMDKRPFDYEILTGFQLTPDELAYNRTPRVVPGLQSAAP